MANRNKRPSATGSGSMQHHSSSMEHLSPKNQSPDPAQTMEEFWSKQRETISRMSAGAFRESTRHQGLPLARIKKIMKIEDEVRNQMISAESPVILAKAAELLIEDLTLRAWLNTRESRRKTIQKGDIAMAACSNEMFDFLIDIVPREAHPSGGDDADLLADVPISDQVDEDIGHQPTNMQQYLWADDLEQQPLATNSQLVQLDGGQFVQATQIGQPIQLIATDDSGTNRRFQFVPTVSSASSHRDNRCDGEQLQYQS